MKRIAIICIQGICLLAMAGCTVGPDYRRPGEKVPASWNGLEAPAVPRPSIATDRESKLADWWNNFNDPLLTSLVDKAIQSNLDVKQATARIRQARASRGVPRRHGGGIVA